MLTTFEKMLFVMLSLIAVGATYAGFLEMAGVINRGEGRLALNNLPRRASHALWVYLSQQTTLKTRRVTSLFHLGVVWGFTFYFLVNVVDALWASSPARGVDSPVRPLYDPYRVAADLLSIAVLAASCISSCAVSSAAEERTVFHDNVLLHPKVKGGAIRTDSAIVAGFILLHVGARFLGEAVAVAQAGQFDIFMPFASAVSVLFGGIEGDALILTRHFFWWVALGGILLFSPYFAYSKHAHLFMAPLNYLTKPERTSLGEMKKLDLEDENAEQFGVKLLEHLPQTGIFDAFAVSSATAVRTSARPT